MGLAYSSLDKHKEAVDNFKKALELEPDNESYKSNLQVSFLYNTQELKKKYLWNYLKIKMNLSK